MNTLRTRNDTCLLCKKSRATATSSHIYTKFITASMFGDKHNKKGGKVNTAEFSYGSDANDTPKQDFLMCPNCENIRLGMLETYISTFFYNRYRNEKFADKFIIEKRFNVLTNGIDRMILVGVHTGMFKLYIYSLIWRASVCTLDEFKNFKLTMEQEDMLRNALDIFLQQNAKDTITFYDSHRSRFRQLPFLIHTHLEQTSAGRNSVLEPMQLNDSSFIMYLNEFIIIFYTKFPNMKMLTPDYNPGIYPISLTLLNYHQWRKLMKILMRKTVNAWVSNHEERFATETPKSRR